MTNILMYNPATDSYNIPVELSEYDVAWIRGDTETMERIRAERTKRWEGVEEEDPFKPEDPPVEFDPEPWEEDSQMYEGLRRGY